MAAPVTVLADYTIHTVSIGAPNGFNILRDVALNRDGTALFICESTPPRIHRLDLVTGELTVVAGNGVSGFSGDGGPAVDASFKSPEGLAVDAQGNLWIGDTGNSRLRRVDAVTGIVTTMASLPGATDVEIGPDGLVYVIAWYENSIYKLDPGTGQAVRVAGTGMSGTPVDGGKATDYGLHNPHGIALDAQNDFYIASNSAIFKVEPSKGRLSYVAGQPEVYGFAGDGGPATEAVLNEPRVVEVDDHGNVFIADTVNLRIRRVEAATGIIDTVAGNGMAGPSGDGGPALDASLSVSYLDLKLPGTIYFTDGLAYAIRSLEPPGPMLSLVADPSTLCPPNHDLIDVTVGIGTPDPNGPVSLLLDSVSSTEPDDAAGLEDGITTGDIRGADVGTEDYTMQFRAERSGPPPGRTYIITYQAIPASGDPYFVSATVAVPQEGFTPCPPINVSAEETPAGTALSWNPFPGATGYDVVRGEIGSLVLTPEEVSLGSVTCVEDASSDTTTGGGFEDPAIPSPGEAFFYLVEFVTDHPTGFGSPWALAPRIPDSAACP